MNKRKILALALTVAMIAILAVGGSLAYFTADDSAKNVFTLGGVSIAQNETKKDGTPFEDNIDLIPMVDNREDKEANPVVNGWFDEDMKNVVDKAISVENTGKAVGESKTRDAYVRTLIAFEGRCDVQAAYIGKLWNTADWEINWVSKDGQTAGTEGYAREVMINGVVHTVVECIHKEVLPAGEETNPSLKQIFLAPTANNEISEWFGSDYTIYAVSQATQTEGFDGAEDALDAAFGDPATVSDQVMFDWFKDVE